MLNSLRRSSDQLAITLSGLCTLHCLALPLVLTLLPAALASAVSSEAFHLAMIGVVIPTSLFALIYGCRQHNKLSLIYLGLIGLSLLVTAAFAEDSLSRAQETMITLSGSILLAIAHLMNYRQCRHADRCECSA